MIKLSFTKGIPIATINEGKFKGLTINIFNPNNEFNQFISEKDSNKVFNQLEKGIMSLRKGEYIKDDGIFLFDGNIFPIPPTGELTDRLVVSGPTHCGKSTFIGLWGKEYKKLNKKKDIILLSNHKEDPKLDFLKPIRIDLNELVEEKPELEVFKNSLVIFDDADNGTDKNINKTVRLLENNLLQNGRKQGISVAITSHLMNDREHMRIILNDTNYVIFFPGGGAARHSIEYNLKHYVGLSIKHINRILDDPYIKQSEWVCIKKTYPMAVIYKYGVYLI